MARMYVGGVFEEGVALATSIGAPYAQYLKSGGTSGGLDPMMVSADVAVGLARSGLAFLTNGDNGSNVSIAGASQAAIIGAYAADSTVITGPVCDWITLLEAGLSTMDRLRARALESLVLVQAICGAYTKDGVDSGWDIDTGAHTGTWAASSWIASLRGTSAGAATWNSKSIPVGTVQGWGGTEAPRGALMHQCEILDGKITKYQCIVPTTWNGSPTDHNNLHGAIEAATIGVPFAATDCPIPSQGGGTVPTVGGVEVLRVAQSFDPCIACAIH